MGTVAIPKMRTHVATKQLKSKPNPFLHSNHYPDGRIEIDGLCVDLVETNEEWSKLKVHNKFRAMPPRFRKFLSKCHPYFLTALLKLPEDDQYRFVGAIEQGTFDHVTEHRAASVNNTSIVGGKKVPPGSERKHSRVRVDVVDNSEVLVVEVAGYPPAICDIDIKHLVEGRHWFGVQVEEHDLGDHCWIRRERGMPVPKQNVSMVIPHPVATRPDGVDPESADSIYLAVLALGLHDKRWGDIRSIRHINGDCFDCRKSNLVLVEEYEKRKLLYEYIQSNPKCRKQRARFAKWFFLPKTSKKQDPDPFDGSNFVHATNTIEVFVESIGSLRSKIDESIANDVAHLMLKIDENKESGGSVTASTVRKYAELFYLAELSVSFLDDEDADRMLSRFDAVEERLVQVGMLDQ